MVIDFHTHIFPDALAARAIGGLEQSGNVKSVLSGRREDLLASMKRAGVDYSSICPSLPAPSRWSPLIASRSPSTGGTACFPWEGSILFTRITGRS